MWQIASATGWSVNYILWGVNLQTLQMMLHDAPHYVSTRRKPGQEDSKPINKKQKKNKPSAVTGKRKSRITELFQSRLK
ncbi:hypothetical protein [Bacteroides acidifaciens]|uniref:hypothetical protein n=1 Tax=Bacteroides acidifaciens TaxID=85831 RepID=UPI00338FD7D2